MLSLAGNGSSQGNVALTIGNFDGFHRGHQALLEQVVKEAAILGVRPALMTFYPSPAQFFGGKEVKPIMMSWRDRLVFLSQVGIEEVHLLHFDQKLATVTAEQFFQNIVCDRIHAQHIVVGDDFHFGYRRQGTPEWLMHYAPLAGVGVTCVPAQLERGRRLSSTWLREALTEGDVQTANLLLGREWHLTARVRYGQQKGREWGFPTANLRPVHPPLLRGVFRVWVKIPSCNQPLMGIANVGYRPSLNEPDSPVLIEVHLLEGKDWNLYGQRMTVSFIERCREERRFESLDRLREQIAHDVAWARERFKLAIKI
jgi:riboflavin kinase / FMN adenylyltransferase